MHQPIRVVIADDHELFASALSMFLASERRLEVIGTASNGADAIDLAVAEDADVVLLDVTMPGLDGFETTRRLLTIRPDARVVLVTGLERPDLAEQARAAGAVGFVLKDRVTQDVVDAVLTAVELPQPARPRT